nr:zinc ribbon domain-containing protein [Anaerolineae bacterium]
MIYCPKCGTANRRGSRFCNECGEPLPMRTALRCPMCGTMNPVGNVYCDRCNARLIPMAAAPSREAEREQVPIKGLSLPTIPLEEGREQQVEGVTEKVGAEKEVEEEVAEDWLAQLRASAVEEAEEPEATIEPIEPVGIPGWLRDLGPIGVETEAATGEGQPTAETPLGEEAPSIPPPIPAEIPEWLQELAPPEAPPTEPVTPFPESVLEEGVSPAPTEIPDWLREIAPPEAAPPEAAPPAAEAAPEETISTMPEAVEVPEWQRETAPLQAPSPAEVPAEEATPPPFVGIPPSAVPEVPEWLREIAPEEAAEAEAAPSVPPLVEFPVEEEIAEAPEWLAELEAEPAPAVPVFEGLTPPLPPESGIEVAEAEGLARAEIPDWLETLRPRPEVVEAGVEEEPLETEGLLEGLGGVLSPAPAIEVPPVRESALPAEVSEVSLARARLLQSLLARPAEMPRPEVRRPGIRIGERLQRWLVAAVLLVAVGGMLMAPLMMLNIPILAQPAVSPGARRLYNVIQSVSAEDTVLVAFEYGPPEADELNLVAEPILRHLLGQGAHISVVSTRPEGLTMAAGLLSTIVASEERYTEEQYTLAGYRPGGATGVSRLLTDAGTPPGLILVLTAQPAPLRWWVEQTRALHGDTLTIVAGVSAALEPAASPYLDGSAGQLGGAINGLSGAAAYESLRGQGGQATQRLNALAAGHVAIVGLMVLGAVFYGLGGLRGRGR